VPPAVLVIVGELLGLQLLRLRPEEVLDESERRHPSMLYADGRDYVAWYRHLSEDERPLRTLHDSLREMLPGLSGLALTDLEQGRRRLVVRRSAPSEEAPDQEYRLSDLSDGERALIVLYTILADARQVGGTICVDEPDNFLALQEIQPWLTELSDLCDEGRAQAILVSHHPELLNYLGWEYGLWLSQDESGRTRVTKLSEKVPVEEDLPEIVARGWIDP
jgi:predicted ATPase